VRLQSMDQLLRADEKMFTEEEQWQTVSQLEVNEPGRHGERD